MLLIIKEESKIRVIRAIGTANPEVRMTQEAVAEKVRKILQISDEEKEKLKRVYRGAKIENRYSVIKDFAEDGPEDFFKDGIFPGIGERMNLYKREVPKLAYEAIENCLAKSNISAQSITHVITCSSTGFYSPGLDTEIISHYNLPPGTGRTCVNNMDYWGFNSLLLANRVEAISRLIFFFKSEQNGEKKHD